MLPFHEARARVLAERKLLDEEIVPLAEAAGRILRRDVTAGFPLPGWDHSAMDGVAYLHEEGRTRWRLMSGESRAGQAAPLALEAGKAMRISTGARLPPGADTVAPTEALELTGDECFLLAAVSRGKNVRREGEDLALGALAVRAGTRLGPGAIALLAALDLGEIAVTRRPRVVILSTGDELRAPGLARGEGLQPDANATMLGALVDDAGGEAVRIHCPDEQAATDRALKDALRAADLVITAGGASKGEHDHVRGAVRALGGTMLADHVAIKPGKPVAVARIGEKLVAILPGNPGAAFVTFHAFAAPLLRGLLGESEPPLARARLDGKVDGARGRTELLRCRLEDRPDGLIAQVLPNQAPGAIVGLDVTDGLAEIAGPTAAGEWVPLHRIRP